MPTSQATARAKRPKIAVPADQYAKLAALADEASAKADPVAAFLHGELARAQVIESGRRRSHVVQIGSFVTYRDDRTGEIREVTLSLPEYADSRYGRISVLAPVGAALLGLTAGQAISYPAADGSLRQLTVLTVANVL